MQPKTKTKFCAFAVVAALAASACGSSDSADANAAGGEPEVTQVIAAAEAVTPAEVVAVVPADGPGSNSLDLPGPRTYTEATDTPAAVTDRPMADDVDCEVTTENGGAFGVKVLIENQSSLIRSYSVKGVVTSADDSSVQDTFLATISSVQPGSSQTQPARWIEFERRTAYELRMEDNARFSDDETDPLDYDDPEAPLSGRFIHGTTTGTTCTVTAVSEQPDYSPDGPNRSNELASNCEVFPTATEVFLAKREAHRAAEEAARADFERATGTAADPDPDAERQEAFAKAFEEDALFVEMTVVLDAPQDFVYVSAAIIQDGMPVETFARYESPYVAPPFSSEPGSLSGTVTFGTYVVLTGDADTFECQILSVHTPE